MLISAFSYIPSVKGQTTVVVYGAPVAGVASVDIIDALVPPKSEMSEVKQLSARILVLTGSRWSHCGYSNA